jgi:hypothetical protein
VIASTATALDNAFPDDVDDIVERVLLPYRPILSHALTGSFRRRLQLAVEGSTNLKPWLPAPRYRPAHAIGALTAGQVALLGGFRPMRILHSVAYDLALPLDGGDRKSVQATEQILLTAAEALDSLADHHVVVPVKGSDARLRRLHGFVRVGVAALLAGTMGALHEHRLWSGRRELAEAPEFIQRYFLGAIQIFGRIQLNRRDQGVFRDHYLEARDIEELADERLGLDAEVERRHGFLKRLATALEAAAGVLTGTERREGDARDPTALASAASAHPALTSATARGARPRTP